MLVNDGEHYLLDGAEVVVVSGGADRARVCAVDAPSTTAFFVKVSRLKKVKQTKKPAEYIQKYDWSEPLLERFKKELPLLLKPNEETTRSELLTSLGVWSHADVEKYAEYDNQLRLLREAMYWLSDNGTLVASSNSGYMLPVSEEAKERCRKSIEQRKSKIKL